jgi:Zn-dependent M28 family amino/carboxypeptidase
MRALVEALCSDRCAGRAPGTPGGIAARAEVVAALRAAGLDPFEQPVPGCGGANVLASLPGDFDRWVLVSAHYDHLGRAGSDIYRGADDNAAAVAILVDVASAIARARPAGRGVLFAAFDAEEPPYFLTDAMGSEYFARHPTIALDTIDLMVCMDLVGHAIGGKNLPEAVRKSVFALGAERSEGTGALVDSLADSASGARIRRADAEIIPPLSDYDPFWRRSVPFIFLTSGRSRRYHTPKDTPEHLDYEKMAATAGWLEQFVRATCGRPQARIAFLPSSGDDASTLRSLDAITAALDRVDPRASVARAMAADLTKLCDSTGRLPEARREEPRMLMAMLESALQ